MKQYNVTDDGKLEVDEDASQEFTEMNFGEEDDAEE